MGTADRDPARSSRAGRWRRARRTGAVVLAVVVGLVLLVGLLVLVGNDGSAGHTAGSGPAGSSSPLPPGLLRRVVRLARR